ncbi:hypothetical protein L1887_31518 [Cichorium endivia]|nr:hypothetical protein L1887_31518 [Cichorium endivia]
MGENDDTTIQYRVEHGGYDGLWIDVYGQEIVAKVFSCNDDSEAKIDQLLAFRVLLSSWVSFVVGEDEMGFDTEGEEHNRVNHVVPSFPRRCSVTVGSGLIPPFDHGPHPPDLPPDTVPPPVYDLSPSILGRARREKELGRLWRLTFPNLLLIAHTLQSAVRNPNKEDEDAGGEDEPADGEDEDAIYGSFLYQCR